MTVFLIANVGNRDLWVDRAAPVPGDVYPQWNKEASRRALGAALLAEWETCRSAVRLPIIGKAVEYVRQQVGRLDRIVLVSSDQSGHAEVDERYLRQDTCTLAPVVKRLLEEQHGLASGAVEHWTVCENPADYGVMQTFYRQRLAQLRDEHPGAVFFLEVSGGTPAMTSMLLAVGAEILALGARPLYVTENSEQPYPLDVGRRLVADSLIRTVRADLDIYAYHAAARTARDNLALLREFLSADDLLAILDYAAARLNLDLDTAWQSLCQIASAERQERVRATAEGLPSPERSWMLREGIYHAEVAYRQGSLFAFVLRVFQFAEGALRLLALQLGVEFADRKGRLKPDGEMIAAQWQQAHPGLIEELAAKGIDISRGANRTVLGAIVKQLCAVEQGDVQGALDALTGLEKVGDLRNRIVHRYHKIDHASLNAEFFGVKEARRRSSVDTQAIIGAMKTAWCSATGNSLNATNPYDEINALCIEILTRSV